MRFVENYKLLVDASYPRLKSRKYKKMWYFFVRTAIHNCSIVLKYGTYVNQIK